MSPPRSDAHGQQQRFLALGDSYTIGEGVPTQARWPDLLARQLRADEIDIADPRIVAVTGWTTDDLAAALDTASLEPPYALVTLLIGVNNQYRGRDVADYRTQWRALATRAVGLAGAQPRRVLAISIPDWGVTRFAREQGRDAARIGAAIDAFNAAAREEAVAAGLRWVDITEVSRACGAAPGMLAADGLHPSGAQYALWLPRIAGAARACLRTPA